MNINRIKGDYIYRLFEKNEHEGKCLTIYVNEEQSLPYWKLSNNK